MPHRSPFCVSARHRDQPSSPSPGCEGAARSRRLWTARTGRGSPNGKALSYSWVTARPAPPDRAAQGGASTYTWPQLRGPAQRRRPSPSSDQARFPALWASPAPARWRHPPGAVGGGRQLGQRPLDVAPVDGAADQAPGERLGAQAGSRWRHTLGRRGAARRPLRETLAPLRSGPVTASTPGIASSSPTGPQEVVRRVWNRVWFHMWNPAWVWNRNCGPYI